MEKAAVFVDAGYYYAQGSYAALAEQAVTRLIRAQPVMRVRTELLVLAQTRRRISAAVEVARPCWQDRVR